MSVTKVDKPWGHELHWAITERYVGKVLHVKAGHALSLQYHNVKDETIFLWTGKLLFEIQHQSEHHDSNYQVAFCWTLVLEAVSLVSFSFSLFRS